jgi:L-rhamnose-H+ transport protein
MDIAIGIVLMFLGAACGGSFGLPSKFVRKETPWENLWGPFFLFATILIPVILGPLIVKDFYAVFPRAGISVLIVPIVFGFLWGLGSMTLGLSFAFIGLSLAYALNYGLQIATGFLVPTLLHKPGQLLTTHGYVALAGVATCILGVIVAGRAAMLRDRSLKTDAAEPETATKKPKMLIGVVIAVVSGVLCACYAVSASFAGPVDAVARSEQFGNVSWQSAFAVVAVIVWGGSVSACGYCVILLCRNRTWGHFARPGVGLILGLALVMAILHDAAIFLWGLGFSYLGEKLGLSIGYAIFMSFAIIVGNVHGFRTGEWKGASRQSIGWIAAGIAILIVGVCLLSAGSYISLG